MDQDVNNNMPVAKPESRSKKFWRVVFGSMLGFFFAQIFVGIFSIIMMISMIAGMSSAKSEIPTVENGTILKISLPNAIVERSVDDPFEDLNMGGYSRATTGLDDVLKSIKYAATDDHIKGIYLNASSVSASPATLKAIRDELVAFKKSGKFIYAYNETYSQSAYYLATTADKIYLNTKGSLEFRGVAFQLMFYKNLLDKLGVDMQVVRHGKFKSAVEPYILDKMSEANREQMDLLANRIWGILTDAISTSRHISVDSLNLFADNLMISTAKEALNYKLVDGLVYRNQFEDILKKVVDIDKDKDLKMVSLSQYCKTVELKKNHSKNRIAVIYAVGEIIDGKGDETTIGSTTLSKDIRDAYKNEDVKAIVLRVNSPGGSALASEVIWNEIEQAKAAGKIVVTSMGDYAASGGYYISCNSDMIVAQPNTLTGSIGVFGLIPNAQKLMKNKLGVNIDVAKTNKHAAGINIFQPMDETEYKYMLAQIEDIYGTFTQRVADGRGMLVEKVDEIGQGRVWSGADAIELGLVDRLGSLDDAIDAAAELAKISDYGVDYYPLKKSWFMKILDKKNEELSADKIIRSELGDMYFTYEAFKKVLNMSGIQARMPMEIKIEE